MKIYYYKQQQNTFALFDRKVSRVRRHYFITILLLFTAGFLLYWGLHHHTTSQKTLASATLPVSTQRLEPTQLSVDEEEARVTTLKIQNNIQQNSQKADEANKKAKITANISNLISHQAQTITVKPHDTLGKIFKRMALNKKEISQILHSGQEAQVLKKLKPGQKLSFSINENHLQQLSYAVDPVSTLLVTRVKGNRFKLQIKTIPLESKQAFAKFTVYGSVVTAAKKSGLNSRRISQLAGIFKSSVDFNKGNHTGDQACVLFQDYFLNGKKIKEGEIIAAEYKTATNTYQVVRFTDPKGNSGYYAPDGTSMQKRFLPAPVKFTRISSLFNPKRWHPVLHRFRHHQGVDYAAPYGTPIKSVANGTIALLGGKGGYGNTIIIKHDSSYSTLYGHLSKYASGLKIGSHVQQGQLIGYVGSSGLATGPHLHFEFRINGVHHNPLTVALPSGKSITHAYRNKFRNEVKKLLARIDAHRNSTRG